FVGKAWELQLSGTGSGASWVVREDKEVEVRESDLLLPLPFFEKSASVQGLPSPHHITAIVRKKGSTEKPTPETYLNPWRLKANGKRVLSFPIWLYCDDTSGNVSKKWNKHNSFLFTAAGLPRTHVQREYNVHFLSTSNIAPPLEMLDGIVEQLQKYQDEGIVCWDVIFNEDVIVLVVVLALLGDNPMQSELACHIGLTANLFCRVCWVSSRIDKDDKEKAGQGNDEDRRSVSSAASGQSSDSGNGEEKKSPAGQVTESRESMIDRVKRFMQKGVPRNKTESQDLLRNIFTTASRQGGKTESGRLNTQTGLKDRFADHFISKIFKATKYKYGHAAKVALDAEISKLPTNHESPVWRIKGLDPHSDTPVEILHVILLGILKYFWRDAVDHVPDKSRPKLVARLSSLNTAGLKIPTIGGTTLVQYCRSLTGRDFRVIAQAAPFVLHDLGLPTHCLQAWMALCSLIPLVWQPEIHDLEQHISAIRQGIDHLLTYTVKWTPRWFNKPKFHILLHLVDHIRDFGPAPLFATEAFESFNAIIRLKSVHSNRMAPSRDIARAFAQVNRLRHLISGGFFEIDVDHAFDVSHQERRIFKTHTPSGLVKEYVIRQYGPGPRAIAKQDIVSHYVGFYTIPGPSETAGRCIPDKKKSRKWDRTLTGSRVLFPQFAGEPPVDVNTLSFKTAESVELYNGDICKKGAWVLVADPTVEGTGQQIATIWEILQIVGSPREISQCADFVTIRIAEITGISNFHYMPTLCLTDRIAIVRVKDINCSANVQHNCQAFGCEANATVPIMEEREVSGRTRDAVRHIIPEGSRTQWILNTAKMRDAIYVQKFRHPPSELDRDFAIQEGVVREIAQAKETRAKEQSQKKGGSKGRSKGKMDVGIRNATHPLRTQLE
ncbi:hypothetical protein FRC02_011569, partial [Tulasnella sp. 418]